MEDLRNSDWQAIQLLLMLLVTVKEDRTAFIMLISASQRGNTQRQGPVPCHLHHFTTGSQVSRTHTSSRAAMIWHQPSGVNPSSVPVCCCHDSQQCFAHRLGTKEQLSSRHRPRTSLFGLLSPSGTRPKSPARSKVHLTDYGSRRSAKDRSIRNSCSFVKGKDRLSLLHWHHLASVYWQKKSKSLLIAISSYSNVFQKKVTMALGMYMPEGQMERQGKD